MRSLPLLAAWIIALSSASTAYSDIHPPPRLNNATDLRSLLDFKAAITRDPQHSLSNWHPNASFCGWRGVGCSARGQRAVALNLSGMALEGSISPSLGNLSFLRYLSLDGNDLRAPIPPQLGRLFRLTQLRLSNNSLAGSIPAELSLLSQLEELSLRDNMLTGSIPSSLGNLSALTQLELDGNGLQGSIPPELGLLSNLKGLYLSKNNLTGRIPSSLSNASALATLDISTNHLAGAIPPELGQLTNLQVLALFENRLTGEIPASLSNCTSLQIIKFNENQLSGGIPEEFGSNLMQLQKLYVCRNELSGSIPASLGNCSKLREIVLANNQLSGEVPIGLGSLPLLERFRLQGNRLVSSDNASLPILSALTNCSFLQEILLSQNQLQGHMHASIGQLSPALTILDLGSNRVRGSIPPQVGNLTSLIYLDLSNNLLAGGIPSELKRLKKLERIYLNNNRLEGGIFPEIDQVERLGLLSVSNNMLSGKFPRSLCGLQQLRRLYLDHNQFSGNIPSSIGECQTLELLDMSHNRFTGSIPPEVASLQNLLFYLNLSSNSLQGSLPPQISKITMALAVDISANKLSGIIPGALGSCIALQYLNLSQNTLQGPIPTSLGKLQNIQVVDLSSNFLSGAVPKSFKRLAMLRYIDLSFNNLSGEVSQNIFANSTAIALFEGNSGLCGMQMYSLPPCPRQRNHSLMKIVMAAIASIGISILCLILGFTIFKRHELHKQRINLSRLLPATVKSIEHPKISYQELAVATNGFSEANLLGIGSFGSVYKGILNDGTIIAVKVFNLENEEAHRSFDRECKVLRSIRHRNLVKIITSCSNFDFKCLVMQFMPNGSLEQHLYHDGDDSAPRDTHGMSLNRLLDIAIDAAQGVSYLHHDCFVQVVHCDLKPSNLLLDDNMTTHVTDFGIAQLIGSNSMDSLTSTLALKGSIGYIAPEYGLGAKASPKGDVYSFGIVLLEMLTRKKPVNDIFMDGLSLPKWVSMAFPNRIREVVDNSLLMVCGNHGIDEAKILDCLAQFLHLGLLCTNESPDERPNMREIVSALEKLKGASVGIDMPNISYLLGHQIVVGNDVEALER